jgi:ketosteroid isomerase-like protein
MGLGPERHFVARSTVRFQGLTVGANPMHFLRGATAVVFLLAGCARAHVPAASPIPSWAATFLDSWYSAYNNGDAAGVATLFAPDAVFGGNTGHTESAATASVAIGRTAIEGSLAADFARMHYTCRGSYDGVQEFGVLAVAWGHESCLRQPKDSTKTQQTYKRWLRVFGVQESGKWVVTQEAFEPVQSPKPGEHF